MVRDRIAGLDVVLAGGSDGGSLVVLLHGYGAPGDDLVALQRVMRVPRETRFVFPAGPIALDMMPGARAWWNIDMFRLQNAIERGDLRDLSTEVPEGLDEARAKLEELLGELKKKFAPPALVLGGFSQGAMLSCDVALRGERRIDALALLSGTLLAKDTWLPKMKRLAGKPIFQSHGAQDPILPFVLAEELDRELVAAGARVTWAPFRGVHEIPGPVVDRLGAFLDGVLAKAT